MAVKKEKLARDSEVAHRQPIELITENGFSIVRVSELDGSKTPPAGKYAFIVRDPNGYELEITVEIDQPAVIEIARRTYGRVSGESTYWICCAERHLAEYLWENDDYPPDAFLEVGSLTLEDLDQARRWERVK